ncbi:MAG: hypothetical protein LBT05_14595 [Planctomycetaceae bacterium]|jgi:hypothetical protein|nr:hypothetical protein [Planctomycetaceae bacterium]
MKKEFKKGDVAYASIPSAGALISIIIRDVLNDSYKVQQLVPPYHELLIEKTNVIDTETFLNIQQADAVRD